MKIDLPDNFVNDKLIYGDLAIPFTRIIWNLEHNESPEKFWDYVDDCLAKADIERPKFVKSNPKLMGLSDLEAGMFSGQILNRMLGINSNFRI